jgi:hypothetical protein
MSYELPLLGSQELSNCLDHILSREQWAASIRLRKMRDRKLTCARDLGRLLLEAPSTRARDNVIGEVNACENDNDRLYELGEMYLEHYIRLCESLPLHRVSAGGVVTTCRQSRNIGGDRQDRSAILGINPETEKAPMKEMILVPRDCLNMESTLWTGAGWVA